MMDLEKLVERLQEDGLDVSSTDDEKIKHLWHLYVKTDASLKSSIHSLDLLREQQDNEMREVENYMEHIRSLSEEREVLTMELETENDQLKQKLVQIQKDSGNGKTGRKTNGVNDEIKEMMAAQGLSDVGQGGISELVAYLLVERARLMDELDAAMLQSTNIISTPDGPMTVEQLVEVMEQERQDYEDEIQQQKTSVTDAQSTNAQLKQQIEKLQQTVDNNNKQGSENRPHSVMDESMLSSRVTLLNERITELEADNHTLMDKIKTLTLQLQQERDSHEDAALDTKSIITKLRLKNDQHEFDITELQKREQKLVEDKKSLKSQLNATETDLEMLIDKEKHLASVNRKLEGNEKMIDEKLRKQMDISRKKVVALERELEEARLEQDERDETIIAMKNELKDNKQQQLEIKDDADHQQMLLKNKITTLEQRLCEMESDMALHQRELWSTQSDHKKNIEKLSTQSDTELDELKAQMKTLQSQKRTADFDLEEALNHETEMEDELQSAKDRERAMSRQIEQIMADNDDLARKIAELEGEGKSISTDDKLSRSKSLEDTMDSSRADSEEVEKLKEELSSCKQSINELNKELRRNEQDKTHLVDELSLKNDNIAQLQRMVESNISDATALSNPQPTGFGSQSDLTSINSTHAQHQVEILRMDMQNINRRLDVTTRERDDLQARVTDKQTQIEDLKDDLRDLRIKHRTLNDEHTNLRHQRDNIEKVYKSIQDDNNKAWYRVKEITLEMKTLEVAKNNLEDELDRKAESSRNAETVMSQKCTEYMSIITNLKVKNETTENQLRSVETELQMLLSKLRDSESQYEELSSLRSQLSEQNTELTHLRTELQEHKLQNTITVSSMNGLKTQIDMLKQREVDTQSKNQELHRLLHNLENKITTGHDGSQHGSHSSILEDTRVHITDQVIRLESDLKLTQQQLLTLQQKYDAQMSRYMERKARTKLKLQRARDIFNQERSRYREEIDRSTTEREQMRQQKDKEIELRKQIEDTHHEIVRERNKYMYRVTECEDLVRDSERSKSVLQVKTQYLEDENLNLQKRIDSLTQQKHTLDRLLQDYQLEKHQQLQSTLVSPATTQASTMSSSTEK